ncbi:unnamed protein product [Clonostachys rhizophaga]|uniref:AB hydrolase-1 domain-containing protein n=1 Tax=Clonostachys rhizophaga TaxID=160324 RepID=A0A9N9YHP3_9HYPO|nr:unnamed protein product [Clonostachys rhizophaga]
MCSQPSIILLPGSFVRAELYFPLRDTVQARGIDMHVPELLTVRQGHNDTRTPPSMYDDAAMIVSEVEKLADVGKDVIVVSHSYSGIPLTQAGGSLSKKKRRAKGKSGGLVGLGYITSMVPALGESALQISAGFPTESQPQVTIDDQGWMTQANLTRAAETALNNLPLSEALVWVQKFSQHSAQSFADNATQLAYADPQIPISYLLCENDLTIPPENQLLGIQRMEEARGKPVKITRIPGDHGAMISEKDKVADWIVGLAGNSK